MTARREDPSIVELLRQMRADIERLKRGDKGVRQNDIRLGDMVVTTDAQTNEICLENLITGTKTCFGETVATGTGGTDDAEWSYSGPLSVVGGLDDYSPLYVVPADCVATEIVVAIPNTAASDASVCVHFGTGSMNISGTVLAGNRIGLKSINVPLSANDYIQVQLTDTGTDGRDLSVMVRFGTPTVGLSANEACGGL